MALTIPTDENLQPKFTIKNAQFSRIASITPSIEEYRSHPNQAGWVMARDRVLKVLDDKDLQTEQFCPTAARIIRATGGQAWAIAYLMLVADYFP